LGVLVRQGFALAHQNAQALGTLVKPFLQRRMLLPFPSTSSVGRRILDFNWAATALGAVEAWADRLRGIVELLVATPVPQCLIWGDEGILIPNDGAVMLFGAPLAEALGTSCRSGWPALWSLIEPLLPRLAAEGNAVQLEGPFPLTVQHDRLAPVRVELVLVPVRTGEGLSGGLLITFMAISSDVEQQLRESEERYRAFVSNSFDGVYRFEFTPPINTTLPFETQLAQIYANGRFAECNDAFAHMYGFREAAEVIGQSLDLMMPQSDPAVRAYMLQVLEAGYRANKVESQERDRYGATLYFENTLQGVLKEGYLVSAWGVQRNITARKQAESRLQESQERYQTLFESIDQGFCMIEVLFDDTGKAYDYRFLEANQMFEHHTGLKGALGKTARELVPGLEQHWVDIYGQVARTGVALHFEQSSEAMGRWFTVEAVRVGGPGSNKVAVLFTNITAQKQAAADARLLAELGERIRLADDPELLPNEIVRLVGRYFNVQRCYFVEIDTPNDRFVIQYEYYEGLSPLRGEYRLADYPRAVQQMLQQGQVLVVADASGDPQAAEFYPQGYAPYGLRARIVVPFRREGVWASNMVIATSTPREWQPREVQLLETIAERAWNAIEQLRGAVALRKNEARLQQLYAQEQAARAQAEEASRLKDEFLATISHELRTPLTALLGYAHLLQSRKRDEAYIAHTLEKIVRSAKAQAQIVDDLLDASRIITGMLRIETAPLDLTEVVQAALETIKPAVEAKAIKLLVDLPKSSKAISGDNNRLQQVVWNLLSNAVKFTRSGGTVQVRLAFEAESARLTVSDTGQGISTAFLPYVFDRFRQADSTSNRIHGGLGLGLAIVRHLVELHGGSVAAASAGEGQGATFTVLLPLAQPDKQTVQQQTDREQAETIPELYGYRVLIVDDQLHLLELLHDILTPAGAVVELRSNALAGLKAVREWQPDLLIADIAMPLQNGYWLIEAVRALPAAEGGTTPAIALTAYVGGEERARALAAGFQHYVPKPIAPNELLDIVARLARSRQRSAGQDGAG
jgi:PAS domain S-box-containing protein